LLLLGAQVIAEYERIGIEAYAAVRTVAPVGHRGPQQPPLPRVAGVSN
jgi:hypothetical protein